MIDFIPNPIAIQIGPIPIYWYGVCYAIGLAVTYLVMQREVLRKGQDPDVLANGIIIVAVAALIGGRLYHVIDQWQLYRSDPLKIILPPYTGLGVYGGLVTGTLAAVAYSRIRRVSFWSWADIVAPGLFVMQAIGRWGNFFNQELYGAPTNLPWGIAIDCDHRIVEYPCSAFPEATTHFQPLFLYESVAGLLGAIVLLWLGRRFANRLRSGDLLGIFFVWYGIVRFLLEFLRLNNWLFFGIPMAQIFSVGFILVGAGIIVVRHRSDAPTIAEDDTVQRAERARLLAGEEDLDQDEDLDEDEDLDADEDLDDDPDLDGGDDFDDTDAGMTHADGTGEPPDRRPS